MSDSDKIDHIESEEVDTEQIQPDDEADREHYLKSLFEAVFFLSNEPVPVSFFVKNFMIDPTHAKIIIDSLVDEYEERWRYKTCRAFQWISVCHKRKACRAIAPCPWP